MGRTDTHADMTYAQPAPYLGALSLLLVALGFVGIPTAIFGLLGGAVTVVISAIALAKNENTRRSMIGLLAGILAFLVPALGLFQMA
ncbi:hypothetical protein [Streptomyces sp. SPB074]|uniref:hypothetical protein n=1 Tax=Streptomyces sp. (strain SPB074) TaxID=465543 RepID=UPI00017F23A7|nr:hypothetical protein [Streptomyces sp. SPB074]EDY42088.1 hypothetical protein SSBG_00264 [Streptomyces sp. SPB074]